MSMTDTQLDGYLDTIVNAKESGSGNFLRLGNYTLIVKKVLIKQSDQVASKVWCIVEVLVIDAAGVFVPLMDSRGELKLRRDTEKFSAEGVFLDHQPINTDAAFAWDLNSQMGPSNAKAFFAALSRAGAEEQKSPTWLKEQVKKALAGNYRGYPVNARGVRKVTRKREVIDVFNFEHFTATDAEIEEVRAMLK